MQRCWSKAVTLSRRRKEEQLSLFEKGELVPYLDQIGHEQSEATTALAGADLARHRCFYRAMRKSQLVLDLRSD